MDRLVAITDGLWRPLNVPQVDMSSYSFNNCSKPCLIYMPQLESENLLHLKETFPFFTHLSLQLKAGSRDNIRAYILVQEQRNLFVRQPQMTSQTMQHFSGLYTLRESKESTLYRNLDMLTRF